MCPTTEVLPKLNLKAEIMRLIQVLKNADYCHTHEIWFPNAVEQTSLMREQARPKRGVRSGRLEAETKSSYRDERFKKGRERNFSMIPYMLNNTINLNTVI